MIPDATLLVCAEASPERGMGHLMRSLCVAEEWQRRGGRALVVASAAAPDIEGRCELYGRFPGVGGRDSGEWVRRTAGEAGADVILVDGYAFGPTFWSGLSDGAPCALVAMDDFGRDEGQSAADLIVKPTPGPANYRHANVLVGLAYAPIDPSFVAERRATDDHERSVLVAFGGSDPGNMSDPMARSLAGTVPADTRVVVLRGPADPAPDSSAVGVATVRAPESVAEMFAAADVAVLAAGSMLLEAMAASLPVASFSRNSMQRGLLEELERGGAARYLGSLDDAGRPGPAAAVRSLLADEPSRVAMAQAARDVVDGRGAERIVAAMSELADG